ncbi:MAG: hypothetical protein IJF52_04975 [Clostridia bacterium]|nr:hypothetical protein [Clostridia bacterium]
MKKTLNIFWIISAVFLALGALWGVITNLSEVMDKVTVSGIALIIFGVISVLAAFTAGLKSAGSGWLLFDGIISFICGLAAVFWYVDATLFMVDLIYILGIWLILLGVSQVSRASRLGKASAGKILMKITGYLGVLGGMTLFVRPVYELMPFSQYGMSFLLITASIMVIFRSFAKQTSRG